MDTGKGYFEEITEDKFSQQLKKEKPMVFKIGEVIEVRGSRLRVEKIYKRKIVFKVLPQLKSEDLL